MDQVKKRGARDEGQPRSVREILRNERSAGRLLVRQIYREQTKGNYILDYALAACRGFWRFRSSSSLFRLNMPSAMALARR